MDLSRLVPLVPLAAALPSILLVTACGDAGPGVRGPVSAVLITLDTTNPGALDVYGRDRDLTPNLERFAQDCVVYDQARTVAPLTLPAHASILTGLYPPRHTVRDNEYLPLPRSARTLAEVARQAGYHTAAFVAAVVLSAPYGLAQGFEVYDEPAYGDAAFGGEIAERGRWQVTAAAKAWLDGRTDRQPFLLWVHYFDPHMPYDPPPEFLERARGQPYLGEVTAVDQAVGDLLARLATEPDYDDMLIVVVGDHGESRGRHGESTHSLLAYDSTLRVPLMIRYPGGRRGGQRSDETVSVVDLFPTMVEAMGLSRGTEGVGGSGDVGGVGDVDGLSLVEPGIPADRGVYFECLSGYLNYGYSPLAGWANGASKYLHDSRPELFDLARDPGEEHDLFDGDDPRVQGARTAIARVAGGPFLQRTASEERTPATGADVRELGYAGAASPTARLPHPLKPSELPPARTRLEEYYRVMGLLALPARGQRDEAIEGLRGVVASNPRNAFALELLGQNLVAAGRPREAIEPLEAMIALGLDRARLRQHLAAAFVALGDFERALVHLERADELCPGNPRTASGLEMVRQRLRSAVGPGDGR